MGSSTIGKGDTSRPGVRGDKKGGGYGVYTEKTYSNIGAKGHNLAGYTSIAPNPTVQPNKGNLLSNLPKPTGVETVTPVKVKNVPRTYVPVTRPPVKKPPVKKPPVKKPPVQVVTNVTREKLSATKALPSNKPPATRFGVVTGKITGTRVSGGAGYGGGGTRGSGSLSGSGSGSRTAGTSRTGGTRRNDPVRG